MIWPFSKKTIEIGGPSEEEILQGVTYLRWRTTYKIIAIINENRQRRDQLPFHVLGNGFQSSYYPRLRNLVRQALIIESNAAEMTDEDISATDDERINTRVKIATLLVKKRGAPPIYKRNPHAGIIRESADTIVLPQEGLVTI